MLVDLLKDTINENVYGLKPASKGWMSKNCMLCQHRGHSPDTRGRFGLKFSGDEIGVNCFNCMFRTRFKTGKTLPDDFVWFLGIIGVPQIDIKKLKFQAFRESQSANVYATPILNKSVTSKWAEMPLPEDALTVIQWLEAGCDDKFLIRAATYIVERCLDPSNLYWAPSDKNRFILPFVYRGKNVGYTARYTKELSDSKLKKYINHSPEEFIFNLDAQENRDKKYCLLHEGVLDAYLTTGISSMGNTLTGNQIDLINRLEKDVIVCPDRDAAGSMLIDLAIEQKWKVAHPNWGPSIKDAGMAVEKYGRILTIQSLIESATGNPLKIHVTRKLDNFYE